MQDYFSYGIIAFPLIWLISLLIGFAKPCWGCYSSLTQEYLSELEKQHGVKIEESAPHEHDDEYEEWSKRIHKLWEEKTGKKSKLSFWANLPF